MTEAADRPLHALIVGASSGIGYALAERLSGSHKVTGIARRPDRLSVLAAKGVSGIAFDVAHLDGIAGVVEQAVAQNGKISALIYCAGAQSIKPMRILKPEDIENVIRVNLTAAIMFARLFASPKITENNAVFCAVSSIAGKRPEPAIVPYSAAKAGLNALVKGLARECGPRRAVGVAPGWLDTEMTRSFPQVYGLEFQENLQKRSPCGVATVDSVVGTIAFLLSSDAAHITGEIVTVDGGAAL
jgi:NAD(P)-dependent dehydrogenase (short-subunit alcohol dehydrogenase family)